MSLSAYVCAKLGDSPGPRTRRNPGPDMVLLAKVLGQLGKTGSNLNQIAHRLNEYDFEGVTELLAMRAEHEAALAEHRIVYNAILAALGV